MTAKNDDAAELAGEMLAAADVIERLSALGDLQEWERDAGQKLAAALTDTAEAIGDNDPSKLPT